MRLAVALLLAIPSPAHGTAAGRRPRLAHPPARLRLLALRGGADLQARQAATNDLDEGRVATMRKCLGVSMGVGFVTLSAIMTLIFTGFVMPKSLERDVLECAHSLYVPRKCLDEYTEVWCDCNRVDHLIQVMYGGPFLNSMFCLFADTLLVAFPAGWLAMSVVLLLTTRVLTALRPAEFHEAIRQIRQDVWKDNWIFQQVEHWTDFTNLLPSSLRYRILLCSVYALFCFRVQSRKVIFVNKRK